MKDQLVVIPARMRGTRFPGKPLVLINGLPMIHHVWNRCVQVFASSDIVVATEDEEIVSYCSANGLNAILTGIADSAIDRIKLVSDIVPAKTYINVQGDEPLVNIHDIRTISKHASTHPKHVIFGLLPKTSTGKIQKYVLREKANSF